MKTILKVLAVLFSLSVVLGYSIYRQKHSNPTKTAEGFPETPASPTMFNTSRSGRIEVDPVSIKKSEPTIFGSSKGLTSGIRVEKVPEPKGFFDISDRDPAVSAAPPQSNQQNSDSVILFGSSKSGALLMRNTGGFRGSGRSLLRQAKKTENHPPEFDELIDTIQNPTNPHSNIPTTEASFMPSTAPVVPSTKSAPVLAPGDIIQWTEDKK